VYQERKKQALRSKIKAIGERDNKKKKISNDNLEVNVSAEGDEIYICNTCNNNCDWVKAFLFADTLKCLYYLLNMKYIFF
jgi:hypothetical protein